MRHKKAGRGMGVDFAKAALAAGYAVVASGRDPERVPKALDSQVVADLKAQIDSNRDLSTSLALEKQPATRAM